MTWCQNMILQSSSWKDFGTSLLPATAFSLQSVVSQAPAHSFPACLSSPSGRELRRRGEEVYSDPLVVYGLEWKLKIYPVQCFKPLLSYIALPPCPPTSQSHSLSIFISLLSLRMAIGRILAVIWRSFLSCRKASIEQHGNLLL